jgi:hypothetical protein
MLALFVVLQATAVTLDSASQSLTEVARKEAERRQRLAQQGIQEKRIDGSDPALLARGGAISTSAPDARSVSGTSAAPKTEVRESLRFYQTRLQKLDRDIGQAEQKLKLLRLKAAAERWAPIKTAKGSRGSGSSSAQDQTVWEIKELEIKLESLRRERADTFQAGRKAGYLPGELEGRVR